MPSDYAHYRFGIQALPGLPRDLQRSVGRFRQLYDVGQHGPDPFFHYNILKKTSVGKLASDMHLETGLQFFTRAANRLRNHPSEAGTVYLYAFLGHFCLDSVCHPYVHAHTDEGPIGHTEMEIEFDRYLLELDGKNPPYAQDFSSHMALSRNESATAAELLQSVTAGQVYRSNHNMAMHTHLLHKVSPRLLGAVLKGQKQEVRDQVMPMEEYTRCSFLNAEFYALYEQALALYPVLVQQLSDHLARRAPFGEEFKKIYG